MQWSDLITITLVLLALWTFIPRHVRRAAWSGLAPGAAALLDSLHELATIARNAAAHVAYRGLLGVPVPADGTHDDDEPEPLRSDEIPLPAAVEPPENRSVNLPELALNAIEVAAVQRMIAHNKTAAKPSKSSTIHAGFGVSRGGSAAYTRASLIYDTLFGPPNPAVVYRERTPEQELLRKELGLRK